MVQAPEFHHCGHVSGDVSQKILCVCNHVFFFNFVEKKIFLQFFSQIFSKVVLILRVTAAQFKINLLTFKRSEYQKANYFSVVIQSSFELKV